MNKKLSVLVPTFNCEKSIRQTLESVKWADEIIIIDSFSTDNTLLISKEYTDYIYQKEYLNSAHQKNNAIDYCNNEWIFQIDSDELLSEKAEKIICAAIDTANDDIDCFKMPRKNYVLGKWVKHGGLYPDWEYRLFRKTKGRWLEKEVHSRIEVSGRIEALDLQIIHHGMPNISKQLENLNRYTRYEADELKNRKMNFSIIRWIFSPPLIIVKKYIIQQGFRDGWRGFFLAVYSAIYVFLSHAKLKEIEMLNLEHSPKSN
tara:strand:+ start:23 stop:802 length:780 start_codon:yes stop_codon:yes gene_type:complete